MICLVWAASVSAAAALLPRAPSPRFHARARIPTLRRARAPSMALVDTTLTKPMGIVFEENDTRLGGIYVAEVGQSERARGREQEKKRER